MKQNTFAHRLRVARLALGEARGHKVTQQEAAALLELTFAALSAWERGKTEPPLVAQEGALARLERARIAALREKEKSLSDMIAEALGKEE